MEHLRRVQLVAKVVVGAALAPDRRRRACADVAARLSLLHLQRLQESL